MRERGETRTEFPRRARKRTGLRVKIAFPVVIILTVILTGLLVFSVALDGFRGALSVPSEVTARVGAKVYLTICALSLLGMAFGIVLAIYVTGPLRELAARAETAADHPTRQPREGSDDGWSAEDVFGDIGRALERMLGAYGALTLDSYTLDSLSGAIVTISEDGTVTSFNPQAERLLDLKAEDVEGESWDVLLPGREENDEIKNLIKGGLEGKVTSVSSKELRVVTKSGRELLMGLSLSQLRGAKDQPLGIVLSFKDLAVVKQARAQMLRADQLAMLGSFAAGMAHEIRNPLASLQGMVELLLEDSPEGDSRRPYLETIQRNLARLVNLTEDLLSMAHPRESRMERVDINREVENAFELVKHEARDKEVEWRIRLADNLPPVHGDREKLERSLLNVLRNAYEATPQKGTIDVTTRIEAANETADTLFQKTESVVIAIANSGSYIPPEQREKLFNPFYTTRQRGTGLGLAITYQIVSAHGGRLLVESEREKGTCFKIILPREPRERENS